MNRGLVSGTLAFFSGFAAVALFGTTVLKVGPILKLNLIESSWLVAIPLVTGAFLRIPFSLLVDKLSRWVLAIQLIIGLIGLIGIIYTLEKIYVFPHMLIYELLLIFGAIAGTGISTFSSGITYVSYFYPQSKQGTALGIFAGLGNTAPGIFTVILPFALGTLGLIYSYIAWAIFLTTMIIIYIIISIDPPYIKFIKEGRSKEEAERLTRNLGINIIPTDSLKQSIKTAVSDGKVWLLTFMYFTSFGGFEALTEWLPTYWKGLYHVPPVEAGILTGVVYSLITALIRVFGGYASDKVSGELISLISYITMLGGSLIFMFSYAFTVSILAEVVMAIGMGIANGAVYKLVPKYSPKAVSGASGWVGGIGSAGGLLIPPAMGYIASMTNFSTAFSVFVVISMISAIFSIELLRKYGRKEIY
ncbi:MFS transporter [Sulfolobus sp. E5-1-F]|uniref:MFS transporter n=1 Tax=Saccharolobus sp. E5-1-F TaxID=2663019 RepID=UPI001294CBA1|nr:MFS transporter [Sulfolobus sp. E5-1-F]QGA54084.1 MFS transporter [Sulfolobus sp. E5-1-F]